MPTTCAACWRKSRWAPTTPRHARSSSCARRPDITLAVNQNMRYDQSVRACKNAARTRRAGRPGAGHDRHAGHSALDALAAAAGLGDAAHHEHSSPRYVSLLVRRSAARVCQRAARSAHGPASFAHDGRHLPVHSGICRRPAGGQLRRRVDRSGPRRGGRRHRHSLARRGHDRSGPRHDRLARVSRAHAQHARFHQRWPADRDGWRRAGTKSGFPTRSSDRWPSCCARWKTDRQPSLSGRDNLQTMALVEACYLSAQEHRAVEPREISETVVDSSSPSKRINGLSGYGPMGTWAGPSGRRKSK